MTSVLVVFEYPSLNGGERSFLANVPWLHSEGFLVTALVPPGSLERAMGACGVEAILWPSEGQKLSLSDRRSALATFLLQRKPDLVHSNSLSMSRMAGPVLAERRIPSLGHLRDILKLSSQVIADLNRNDRLLAVSQATREFHGAQGLLTEKTHVLHNGVDLIAFGCRPKDGRLHRELGLDPKIRLVGSIGQIGMRKGVDDLLRAAEVVVRHHPSVHFVLIGERHSGKDEAIRYERALHARADSPELQGRCHFLGTRDDVQGLLPELTVLAHPSRQEPLGRVLLEAAACGIPIVATDVGGTREIFPDPAGAAKLVSPACPEELGTALCALLNDQGMRRDLGRRARLRAEEGFDAEDRAKDLSTHYREVLSGERHS